MLEILSQLEKESKSSTASSQDLVLLLNNFFDALKENESSRALVGSKNAVEITLRNLRRLAASSSTDAKSSDEDEDEALFVASVRVLTIMCSKTPANRVKFATFGEAASLIMDRMKSKPNSAKTQVAGFNAVRTSCTKNPQTRTPLQSSVFWIIFCSYVVVSLICPNLLTHSMNAGTEIKSKQCECRRCESCGKWCVATRSR